MGDPRKQRRKYSTPNHPWLKERIETEGALSREYGLKNRREIWKMKAILSNFALQAKKITANKTAQADTEKAQMLAKLTKLGIISGGVEMDQVLALTPKDIMERRLQSLVFRKGLAKSMKQARQMIVHRHIMLNGKKLTSPAFLVPKELEGTIAFSPNSQFIDEMHPERVQAKAEAPKAEHKAEHKPAEHKAPEQKAEAKPEQKPAEKKPKAPKAKKEEKKVE